MERSQASEDSLHQACSPHERQTTHVHSSRCGRAQAPIPSGMEERPAELKRLPSCTHSRRGSTSGGSGGKLQGDVMRRRGPAHSELSLHVCSTAESETSTSSFNRLTSSFSSFSSSSSSSAAVSKEGMDLSNPPCACNSQGRGVIRIVKLAHGHTAPRRLQGCLGGK